ncbi:MAG: hypothetical protein ABRQ39_13515 [Candidatus Eremiobacterota bacterium]
MNLINLKCETCGAQLKRTASMRTLQCEYCGSKYLAEIDGQSQGLEDRTFILPVNIEEDKAKTYILRETQLRQFVHENTDKEISMVSPNGVMLPCYTFECDLTSNWYGENAVQRTRQVINQMTGMLENQVYEEWYPQNGQHYGQHNAFVSASGALKESEAKWGELFPLPLERKSLFIEDNETQRFSLEIPNMSPEEAWGKGEAEAKRLEEEACKTLVGRLKGVNSKINKKEVSLVYTPVWIFNYKVDNIPYRNLVCGTSGKVIGEMPTNFDRLFEKLRSIQQEMSKMSNYFIIAIVGTILSILLLFGTFLLPFTACIIYYLYQKRNDMQKKFDEEFEKNILTNKYNLCYYILRKRTDLNPSLNLSTLSGISAVERCLDEEEGGKIDNIIVKELVARYLVATNPAASETPAEKIEKMLGMKKTNVTGASTTAAVKTPEVGTYSGTVPGKCKCGQTIKEGWKVCPMCGNKF